MLADTLTWQEEKEARRQKALEKHRELHKLYKENRFLFEKRCREMIKGFINGIRDPSLRNKLWDMQMQWDKMMRNAGHKYNRLALAQTFFWNHFYDKWLPAINNASKGLNKKAASPFPKAVK